MAGPEPSLGKRCNPLPPNQHIFKSAERGGHNSKESESDDEEEEDSGAQQDPQGGWGSSRQFKEAGPSHMAFSPMQEEDEEAELQRALALSLDDIHGEPVTEGGGAEGVPHDSGLERALRCNCILSVCLALDER